MPHKRKSRVNSNQKSSATRRAQVHVPHSEPPQIGVHRDQAYNPRDVDDPFLQLPGPQGVPPRPAMEPPKMAPFAMPQYNSCLRNQEEINAIKNIRAMVSDSKLSKTVIGPLVTKKMNFAQDQVVFKNLLPLNVNDSVLEPLKQARSSSKVPGSKESAGTPRSSEPQLADYAEKIDPIMLNIPEPDLHFDFEQKPYDFIGAYRKMFA
ncbi:hypothetical protein KR018_010612 [Drosophila ironensis]|nr:hypothetical protein KR018_010612 [Drosophila ironensis]